MVICVQVASLRRSRTSVGPASPVSDRATGPAHWLGAALALAVMFAVLLIGVLVQPVSSLEIQVMQALQRPDDPSLYPVFDTVKSLTGSEGAILAWVVTGLVFLSRRWWAPAVAVGLIPIGGVINEGISIFLVERSRPHLDVLFRTSLNFEERSFPSGHVTGAVLLYGLIFVVARRIDSTALRRVTRSLCVAIVLVTGYQRVWGGAHWPTDVLAAYALGGLLLIGVIAVYKWLDPHLAGLPLGEAVGRLVDLVIAPVRERRPGSRQPVQRVMQPMGPGAAAHYLASHPADHEDRLPAHRPLGIPSETGAD